jgi:GTP cyclohydrolase I
MNDERLPITEEVEAPGEADSLAQAVRSIIRQVGEDPGRDGLLKTPQRVARSLRYLTSGYQQDVDKILNGALYDVAYDEMVIVKDIEIFSLCEHHMLPFYGRCHIGYIAHDKVLGVSKLARIVDTFAHRLQAQERLTGQIADFLMRSLRPLGVAVVLQASHSCMTIRGIRKPGSMMVTSALRGTFKKDARSRSEVLSLMHNDKG